MFIKTQYLIYGISFLISSISVIVSASRPKSLEEQLISEITLVNELYESNSNDIKEFISKAGERKKEIAKIIKNLQKKKGDWAAPPSFFGSKRRGGQNSFEYLIKKFGGQVIKEPNELNKMIDIYSKNKYEGDLYNKCNN